MAKNKGFFPPPYLPLSSTLPLSLILSLDLFLSCDPENYSHFRFKKERGGERERDRAEAKELVLYRWRKFWFVRNDDVRGFRGENEDEVRTGRTGLLRKLREFVSVCLCARALFAERANVKGLQGTYVARDCMLFPIKHCCFIYHRLSHSFSLFLRELLFIFFSHGSLRSIFHYIHLFIVICNSYV